MELHKLTVHKAHELLKKKEITSQELVRDLYKKIEDIDDRIKAYVTLDKEKALQSSIKIDEKADFKWALSGIPVAVNDNICTKNIRTTCCSKMLADFVPPYDATVITKLKSQDTVILGKTNMDEFAMGSSTEKSHFHPTKNPWDFKSVPGGSSGGSAAAVRANECIYSIGSDTGGGIRQPASFCGVVGLKPTYGRVSRYGLTASASSMDTIGIITKDVTDCALVLNAIAGNDTFDPTSINIESTNYVKALNADIKGAKIGVPKEFLGNILDKDVKEAVLKAVKTYEALGCHCEEISIPHTEHALWAYYIIAFAEASSEMGQYDGIRYGYRAKEYKDLKELYKKSRGEGFGAEVKRRIILGTFLSDAKYYDKYYLKAQKVRTLIKNDFEDAFKKYDFLITPTVQNTAFKIGEKINDALKMYMNDSCTVPVSLASLPAISVPCGFSKGLPIGLQILGKPFDEETVLKAAYTFEQNTDYHTEQIEWKEG